MLNLSELLETIRQQYIDSLAMALHEAKNEPGAKLISEAVLRNEQGEPVLEGTLNLPMRVDAVVILNDAGFDSISVDSTSLVSGFVDITFTWPGEIGVTLNPFAWDALTIYLPEAHLGMDWEPLLTWYEEWFRAEEDGIGDLLLVVHHLSDPQARDEGVEFQIDLGSADIGVIEDLLDALAGLDISRVELGARPTSSP